MPTFAIVLTHNRPELLAQCLAAIGPQVDLTLIVDNASDPPVLAPLTVDPACKHIVLRDEEQPPNLSRLWNLGFDWIAKALPDEVTAWDVAVLCDDAIAPPGWFATVVQGMRAHGAAIGCTHSYAPVSAPILKTERDSDIHNRMPGWAFVMAGERHLRADERLRWWWCDSMLDIAARESGGMVVLPGPSVPNMRPNDFTNSKPELGEQAGRDGEMFAQINEGWRPW